MSNALRCILVSTLACALSACSVRLPVESHAIAPQAQRQVVASTATDDTTASTVPVWLFANDYHTGMVFPYPWLVESGFIPPQGFPDSSYVAMSWGNTDAYSEHGVDGPGAWFEVLFTPTESVMEMIPVNYDITKVMPQQRIWIKQVPRERGPQLAHFLNQCCLPGADGRPSVVRPSSWGKGVQLASSHSYFIPRVCNVWSLQAVEALGGEVRLWSSLTADGLIRQIERPVNGYRQIWNAGKPVPSTGPAR